MKKLFSVFIFGIIIMMFSGCGNVISPVSKDIEAGKYCNGLDLIAITEPEKYDVTVKENYIDIATLGSYDVIYVIYNKDTKKVSEKTLTFNVVDKKVPVIKVADELFIVVDSKYDLKSFITVNDSFDQSVTADDVKIDTNLDITKIGSYNVIYHIADASGNESTAKAIVNVIKKPNKIGDTISAPNVCDVTISQVRYSPVIKPAVQQEYSSCFEVSDKNNTYMDVIAIFKNLAKNDVIIDDIVSATLYHNGNDEYACFFTVEMDGDFEYSNIAIVKPWKTAKTHLLFEIPKTLANSDDDLVLIVSLKNAGDFRYKIR